MSSVSSIPIEKLLCTRSQIQSPKWEYVPDLIECLTSGAGFPRGLNVPWMMRFGRLLDFDDLDHIGVAGLADRYPSGHDDAIARCNHTVFQ